MLTGHLHVDTLGCHHIHVRALIKNNWPADEAPTVVQALTMRSCLLSVGADEALTPPHTA